MKKLFKDIRNNNVEAIQAAIAKNPAIVNEYFDGKAPKKDIGQSPLQVAIKCRRFEIIDLLIAHGADINFMEDPATVPPHSTCMPVLHDVIIGAMDSLLYHEYEDFLKYMKLLETMLRMGADPNKETFCSDSPYPASAVGTLVVHAEDNLNEYVDCDPNAYNISKKCFFDILDLLKKYGADFDQWLDRDNGGDESNRATYLDEFIPKEDQPYEMKYRGKIMKGVHKGNIDQTKVIRAALREYFKLSS